jgi:hypothetical protein
MSFDLGVWHTDRALDATAADDVYQALCEGEPTPSDGSLTPSPRVREFLAALGARHPDLDSLPDDAVDASPWSSGFEYSEAHAIFNIRWSYAAQMLTEIRELAAAFRLLVYDPQAEKVYNPPHLARPPRWQFWRR